MFVLAMFTGWIMGIFFSSHPCCCKSVGLDRTLGIIYASLLVWRRYLFRLFANYLLKEISSLSKVIGSCAVFVSGVIVLCQVSEQFLLLLSIIAIATRSPKWFCSIHVSVSPDEFQVRLGSPESICICFVTPRVTFFQWKELQVDCVLMSQKNLSVIRATDWQD